MRAQLKGGRIVSGKLAEIFVRKRLATIVSDEETANSESEEQNNADPEKPKRGRKPKTE